MSSPIRVVIAGPYPEQPGIRVGGVQVYSDYLSAGLAAREELDVHVVTAVKGLPDGRVFVTPEGVTVHQLPLCHRYQFLTDSLVNSPRIYRAIREIDPHIVHVQTSRLYPPAALERGYPSVITIHGIYFAEARLVRGFREKFRSLYGRLVEKNSLRRARHVICLNEYARSVVRSLLRTEDVRVIDNAVDDRFFEVVRREEPGRVLFAGLITDRKNLMGLLDAARLVAARYPGLRLRVAGHILDQEYFEQCKRFVETWGIASNVEFLGNVSADGMLDELAAANALVLPAKQETSPMIISEAMAAGTPVIATPVGGMPEVVRDGQTGFIVPLGDAEVLAGRIVELLESSELRDQMGAAARQVAEERFRRSVVLDKTVDFYRDVLRKAGTAV